VIKLLAAAACGALVAQSAFASAFAIM